MLKCFIEDIIISTVNKYCGVGLLIVFTSKTIVLNVCVEWNVKKVYENKHLHHVKRMCFNLSELFLMFSKLLFLTILVSF